MTEMERVREHLRSGGSVELTRSPIGTFDRDSGPGTVMVTHAFCTPAPLVGDGDPQNGFGFRPNAAEVLDLLALPEVDDRRLTRAALDLLAMLTRRDLGECPATPESQELLDTWCIEGRFAHGPNQSVCVVERVTQIGYATLRAAQRARERQE